MKKLGAIVMAVAFLLLSTAATADSSDQGPQSPCSRFGTQGSSSTAGQPNSATAAGSKFVRTAGASASSDCGRPDQDTPDIDSLLGAPRDYDDRYGSTTSSELETRSADFDAGSPYSSASRPIGATFSRKSITASEANNSATPTANGSVYRSPW